MRTHCTPKHTTHPQTPPLDCWHGLILLQGVQLRLGRRLGRLGLYVCWSTTPYLLWPPPTPASTHHSGRVKAFSVAVLLHHLHRRHSTRMPEFHCGHIRDQVASIYQFVVTEGNSSVLCCAFTKARRPTIPDHKKSFPCTGFCGFRAADTPHVH